MKIYHLAVHVLLVVLCLVLVFVLIGNRGLGIVQVTGIVIPSFALWLVARIQIGRSFSAWPEAHELITHGLYSRIRNPLYLFGSLQILGVILYTGRLVWLFSFAVIVPLQLIRIRKEAKVLEAKFGESYVLYRQNTWF